MGLQEQGSRSVCGAPLVGLIFGRNRDAKARFGRLCLLESLDADESCVFFLLRKTRAGKYEWEMETRGGLALGDGGL